jgi:DNA-binding SARP family transcriptional activator
VTLPEPLPTLQRALRRHPTLGTADPTATNPTETNPHTPATPWPTGGIGLVGDGATAAARAAIVAALASGGQFHYHQRAEVILDRPTFAALFGDHTPPDEWPRLTVESGPGHALTAALERILYRNRILNEYNLDDLDTLRVRQPSEEALPPILHLALSPAPHILGGAIGMSTVGANVELTSLYIGQWPGGVITVAADGTTDADDPALQRVAVLTLDDAIAALIVLREAHTGDAPESTSTSPPTPMATEAAILVDPIAEPLEAIEPSSTDDEDADGENDQDEVEIASAPGRAFLRTMGRPGIDSISRGLRAKAAELAVYLACHPNGALVRDIAEYLHPEAQLSVVDHQIHNNASNLRQMLAKVGGRLLRDDGRYRLDPATISVDIWILRANVKAAADADPDRRRQLLQEACDLCVGALAEGQRYEWVEPQVEAVRRWATKAHLMLAGDLMLLDEPQAAATVLAHGIELDRYNEELYRAAMRAQVVLHDPKAIRALMRALTKALSDIDVEPSEESYELVKQLLNEIAAR